MHGPVAACFSRQRNCDLVDLAGLSSNGQHWMVPTDIIVPANTGQPKELSVIKALKLDDSFEHVVGSGSNWSLGGPTHCGFVGGTGPMVNSGESCPSHCSAGVERSQRKGDCENCSSETIDKVLEKSQKLEKNILLHTPPWRLK